MVTYENKEPVQRYRATVVVSWHQLFRHQDLIEKVLIRCAASTTFAVVLISPKWTLRHGLGAATGDCELHKITLVLDGQGCMPRFARCYGARNGMLLYMVSDTSRDAVLRRTCEENESPRCNLLSYLADKESTPSKSK